MTTMKLLDIIFAICHKEIHEAIITEYNTGHFVDKGTAWMGFDFFKVLDETWDDQTFALLKFLAFINLEKDKAKETFYICYCFASTVTAIHHINLHH